MREPSTIKGYLSILFSLEKITVSDKSGYDSLPDNIKCLLSELSGQISNIVSEVKQDLNQNQ